MILLCGKAKIEDDIDLGFKLNKLIVRFKNHDVLLIFILCRHFFKNKQWNI
jgi:hypothetical protein